MSKEVMRLALEAIETDGVLLLTRAVRELKAALALPDAQPATAPEPVRLSDEEISLAVRDKGVRCVHPGAETTIEIGRAVESAIYAKGVKQ